jgi:hypothetical protein
VLLLPCGASLVIRASARIQKMLKDSRFSYSINLDSTESWNGTGTGHDSYGKIPPYCLKH